MRALTRRNPNQRKIRSVAPSQRHTGTSIRVYGYNQNERSSFVQNVVKDYIAWFTKFGSIEIELGIETLKDLKLHLKCLDRDDFELIPFGHPFPPENQNIDNLFNQHPSGAPTL